MSDVRDHPILHLLQHIPRFAQNRLLSIRHGTVRARAASITIPQHTIEAGFDVQEGTRNINQLRISVSIGITVNQRYQSAFLFLHYLARHAKAEHTHGVRHLTHGASCSRQSWGSFGRATHHLIKLVFNGRNFFD